MTALKPCPKCGKVHANLSLEDMACHHLYSSAPDPALVDEPHHGWLFLNPDTGLEWSEQHPVTSGQVSDAQQIRCATVAALYDYLMEAWSDKADQDQQLTAARAEIERLIGEINRVDAVLARRPAIADASNRYTAIEMACNEAGKVLPLQGQLERRDTLQRQIDALTSDAAVEAGAKAQYNIWELFFAKSQGRQQVIKWRDAGVTNQSRYRDATRAALAAARDVAKGGA